MFESIALCAEGISINADADMRKYMRGDWRYGDRKEHLR